MNSLAIWFTGTSSTSLLKISVPQNLLALLSCSACLAEWEPLPWLFMHRKLSVRPRARITLLSDSLTTPPEPQKL